jgi:hypothetical protein
VHHPQLAIHLLRLITMRVTLQNAGLHIGGVDDPHGADIDRDLRADLARGSAVRLENQRDPSDGRLGIETSGLFLPRGEHQFWSRLN